MKKILLLCSLFLIASAGVLAQNKGGIHQISIAPGLAVPLGKLGADHSFRDGDAFAKPGPGVSIRYEHALNTRWSLTAGLLGQINVLNSSAIEASFARELYLPRFYFSSNPGMPSPAPGNRYPNWELRKKQWKSAALLFGAGYRLPLGNGTGHYWTANAALGPAFLQMPQLSAQSVTDTTAAYVIQEKGSGVGVAFSIGTGFQIQLAPHWVLMPGLSFWTTNEVKMSKTKTTITETRGQPGLADYSISQATFTGSLSQKLSTMQIAVGIGYRF